MFVRTPTRIELRAEDMAELDQQKGAKKQSVNQSNTQTNTPKSAGSFQPIINTNKGSVADRIGYRPGQ